MSSHPPFRLRLSLALLVLVLAGVTVGAAALLGSGQEDPAEAETTDIVLAGPPVAPSGTPTRLDGPTPPGLRLGVLDKEQAIAEERDARADARALQALAAQQAAIAEYAAAVAAAETADDAPSGGGTPPPSNGGGGGGGYEPPPPSSGSLYEKLDRIALCESGQNPRAYNPAGPWWGAFQFHWDTWRGYGGGGSQPHDILDHTYSQQREIAANLARARGFSPWPHCSAQLGYT